MTRTTPGVVALSLWILVLTLFTGGLAGFVYLEVRRAPAPVSARPLPPATPAPREVEVPAITARGDLSDQESTTIEIFRRAAPSVVYITKLAVRADPFRRNIFTIPQGTGSGFVWDPQGHIVTNFHVVQGADAARVTLSDQSVWDARLVGYYPDADLAVLRIDAPESFLKPLQVGSSNDLIVGQSVFAIGNPFGLDHTLSTGVVSGLGREIPSIGGRPIQGAIQTDAAINPGNSGGPLLDSAGRLIGVNTQIYSPSGASAGVGFAVPVDTVARVVPQLIAHGRIIRPALGIQVDEGGLAASLGIEGAIVLGVIPRSGAAEVGLRAARQDRRTGAILLGDVIRSIDGQAVNVVTDLYRLLDEKQVGEKVTIVFDRYEGRTASEQTATLTLMQAP